MPTYLDPAQVIGKRLKPLTWNQEREAYGTGYGPKMATSWELQLTDKRWRRVYVMQWSNAGTAYVRVKGVPHLLGGYDPRD